MISTHHNLTHRIALMVDKINLAAVADKTAQTRKLLINQFASLFFWFGVCGHHSKGGRNAEKPMPIPN